MTLHGSEERRKSPRDGRVVSCHRNKWLEKPREGAKEGGKPGGGSSQPCGSGTANM